MLQLFVVWRSWKMSTRGNSLEQSISSNFCVLYCIIIVAAWYMKTCHLLFVGPSVCWSHCQRNQQSLSPGVLYAGRQNGTKFDPLIGQAMLYIISTIDELWLKGSRGAKIQSLQEFFVHHSAECNEIWCNNGRWSVAGLMWFWWSLVQFFHCYGGVTNFFESRYLTHFFKARWNLEALGVWPFDTLSANLVNFGLRVSRYHVATCISPSLMH